jgi:hypothetical protein
MNEILDPQNKNKKELKGHSKFIFIVDIKDMLY